MEPTTFQSPVQHSTTCPVSPACLDFSLHQYLSRGNFLLGDRTHNFSITSPALYHVSCLPRLLGFQSPLVSVQRQLLIKQVSLMTGLKWLLHSVLGWGCSSLVEYWAVTPLMQVRFPGLARDFSPQSQLSVQTLLRVSVHPCVQSHALTSIHTLKIL